MSILGESFAGVATAATRLVERYTPKEKRLFHDPLTVRLLPPLWRIIFQTLYLPGIRHFLLFVRERRMPGTLGAILCRTRYLDDVLQGYLHEGLQQLVILGSGFDTRAYRIQGMEEIQTFELDLPDSVKLKGLRLKQVFGNIPNHVTLVGIDFDTQGLGEVLPQTGFMRSRKTLFLWEGVTQYLTGTAVENTLYFVSEVGGTIAFTYVRKGMIDGSDRPDWFENFLSLVKRIGSPFRFGLDPLTLPDYLLDLGLRVIQDIGADEYQSKYLTPLKREMVVFDCERTVVAEAIHKA